jgi:hypothetical protein
MSGISNNKWISIKIGINTSNTKKYDAVGLCEYAAKELGWISGKSKNDSDFEYYITPKNGMISPVEWKDNTKNFLLVAEIFAKLKYNFKYDILPPVTYSFHSTKKTPNKESLFLIMTYAGTIKIQAFFKNIIKLENENPNLAGEIFQKRLEYLLEDAKSSFSAKEKEKLLEWFDFNVDGDVLGVLILKKKLIKLKKMFLK